MVNEVFQRCERLARPTASARLACREMEMAAASRHMLGEKDDAL